MELLFLCFVQTLSMLLLQQLDYPSSLQALKGAGQVCCATALLQGFCVFSATACQLGTVLVEKKPPF